jgi:pilus assembly protein CpaB
MGKYKPVMLLGIAVIIAFMVSLLVYGYMQRKGRSQEVGVEIQPVVVAAVDLSWGTRITNEVLKKTNFLKGSLTAGYFSDPALVVGRVLIYPVQANEPIFESRLAPAELKTGGVAAVISPKKRAVAVKVDKVIGVSGFIHPGNRVDVLMTLATGRTFNPVTKTILENILVLAVGSETKERRALEEKSSPTDVITLEVTPEEAEKLALAATEGRLQLALRNFSDTENIVTQGTTVSSLVGSQSPSPPREVRSPARREVEVKKVVSQELPPPPPPTENKVENPKPPTHTVELIKGSKVSEVKFEGSE